MPSVFEGRPGRRSRRVGSSSTTPVAGAAEEDAQIDGIGRRLHRIDRRGVERAQNADALIAGSQKAEAVEFRRHVFLAGRRYRWRASAHKESFAVRRRAPDRSARRIPRHVGGGGDDDRVRIRFSAVVSYEPAFESGSMRRTAESSRNLPANCSTGCRRAFACPLARNCVMRPGLPRRDHRPDHRSMVVLDRFELGKSASTLVLEGIAGSDPQ